MAPRSPDSWNVFDKVMKSWSFSNIGKVRQGTCDIDTLPLPTKLEADVNFERFSANWDEELSNENNQPSLMRCLRKTYGRDIFIAGIFKALWSFLVIFAAYYFVKEILQFVDDTQKTPGMPATRGWLLTGFFFLDAILLGKLSFYFFAASVLGVTSLTPHVRPSVPPSLRLSVHVFYTPRVCHEYQSRFHL
jgi:ATP-binding cassette subfamily C (CFTR/MRP) protein 1